MTPTPESGPSAPTVVFVPTTNGSTETTQQMPLVYYYYASIKGDTFTAGSMIILPNQIILSPMLSKLNASGDVADDVQKALIAMIQDSRNLWTSDHLSLSHASFDGSQMTVALSGQIYGAGDIVLVAAKMQFLMTVFANSSVQTAMITLNGENISNLGTSRSSDAQVNHIYTRAEIEDFMHKNTFN